MRYLITCLTCLCICLSVGSLQAAALHWERSEVELTAREGDEEVEASFPFTNKGTKDVQVLTIDTGCGCTVATLTEKRLGAGARGELKVKFKLEGRVGPQNRLITVTTDETPAEPVQLWLRVKIISPVVAAPRMVFWRKGDPVQPKDVEVTLLADAAVKLGEATVRSPEFTLQWVETKEPGKRLLRIVPQATDHNSRSEVTLHYTVGEQKRTLVIYAFVK